MFRTIAIIIGSILAFLVACGALFLYFTGGPNPATSNDLLLKTAYLAKNTESYTRCYNSINYGTVLIGDVRLKILSENFNDDSINTARLDPIEKSFMDTVKQKCQKTVDDYETAYKKATSDQDEINNTSNALWYFFFGSMRPQQPAEDLGEFEPARARMSLAFNEYTFTEQEIRDYFNRQLNL